MTHNPEHDTQDSQSPLRPVEDEQWPEHTAVGPQTDQSEDQISQPAGEDQGPHFAFSQDAASTTPQILQHEAGILAEEEVSSDFSPIIPDRAVHAESNPHSFSGPTHTERPLFQSWSHPEIISEPRIPHFGHLLILGLLAVIGTLCSGLLAVAAVHAHLWGVSSLQKATSEIHYALGSMAVLYFVTFAGAILVLPLFWHKSFFAGLQWNAQAAFRHVGPLAGAAAACFILAMVDELVLPGPTKAPIDLLFTTRTAAWLLFAFGVTLAPFFEEIIFRGFLLPALCTAYDWGTEKINRNPPRPLDINGHPQWSFPAVVVGSILTSIPFAWMHAEQTAYSLGPFVLLVCVSLVLCLVRLATRSLAASVLVHASYNFLLFALMLIGTGGFNHLDKM